MAKKNDIIDRVHLHLGGKKSDAKEALEAVSKSLVELVLEGEKVRLEGLGSVYVKKYENHKQHKIGQEAVFYKEFYRTRFTVARDLVEKLKSKRVRG